MYCIWNRLVQTGLKLYGGEPRKKYMVKLYIVLFTIKYSLPRERLYIAVIDKLA